MGNALESVKVGDWVVRVAHRADTLAKVEKITATQIVLEHGERFRRRDGGSVCRERWYFVNIRPPKEGEAAAIQEREWREDAQCRLRDMDWREWPTESLKRVLALTPAPSVEAKA